MPKAPKIKLILFIEIYFFRLLCKSTSSLIMTKCGGHNLSRFNSPQINVNLLQLNKLSTCATGLGARGYENIFLRLILSAASSLQVFLNPKLSASWRILATHMRFRIPTGLYQSLTHGNVFSSWNSTVWLLDLSPLLIYGITA